MKASDASCNVPAFLTGETAAVSFTLLSDTIRSVQLKGDSASLPKDRTEQLSG